MKNEMARDDLGIVAFTVRCANLGEHLSAADGTHSGRFCFMTRLCVLYESSVILQAVTCRVLHAIFVLRFVDGYFISKKTSDCFV